MRLIKVLAGIAVLAISFFFSLWVMDRISPGAGALGTGPKPTRAPLAPPPPAPLFVLRRGAQGPDRAGRGRGGHRPEAHACATAAAAARHARLHRDGAG